MAVDSQSAFSLDKTFTVCAWLHLPQHKHQILHHRHLHLLHSELSLLLSLSHNVLKIRHKDGILFFLSEFE